jgi:hypothetical protein
MVTVATATVATAATTTTTATAAAGVGCGCGCQRRNGGGGGREGKTFSIQVLVRRFHGFAYFMGCRGQGGLWPQNFGN